MRTSTAATSTSNASAMSSSTEDSATRTSASTVAPGVSASPSSADSGAPSPSRSKIGLAAGLGAGLGVAVLLIAALVFFVVRSRRHSGRSRDEVIVSPYKNEMPSDGHVLTPSLQRQSANKSELPAPSEQMRSARAGDPSMKTEYRSGVWQQARVELGS